MFYAFFSLKRFSYFKTICLLNICGLILLFCLYQWLLTNQRMVPLIIYVMVSQFEFDLHRTFIDHYERCILVPYYHSCQVKFKSIPNIVSQAHCTQSNTCTHTFTHKFAKNQVQGSYLSFLSSFRYEVMLIVFLWLN